MGAPDRGAGRGGSSCRNFVVHREMSLARQLLGGLLTVCLESSSSSSVRGAGLLSRYKAVGRGGERTLRCWGRCFGCPWRDKRKSKCSCTGRGFPTFSRTGAHHVRFVLVAVTWPSHCYQPRHFSTPKLWFPVPRCCHHFTGTVKWCWELVRWPQMPL